MGIKDTATRFIKKSTVSYVNSAFNTLSSHMKLINYKMEVAKAKGKFNRIGVATYNTTLNPGDIVTLDGDKYIIGNLTPDIYKGYVTRYVCELFFCDVTCDVLRRVLQRDADDNIIGSADTTIHQNIPVSWQVSDLFVKGERDQSTEYFNAIISIHYHSKAPLLKEDKFTYFGEEYEVKFIRRDIPGVLSIRVEPVTA